MDFKNWNEKSTLEKSLLIVTVALGVLLIVLAILDLMNVWKGADIAWKLTFGTMSFIEAYLDWNKNRKIAKISLGVGVIMYLMAIMSLFI